MYIFFFKLLPLFLFWTFWFQSGWNSCQYYLLSQILMSNLLQNFLAIFRNPHNWKSMACVLDRLPTFRESHDQFFTKITTLKTTLTKTVLKNYIKFWNVLETIINNIRNSRDNNLYSWSRKKRILKICFFRHFRGFFLMRKFLYPTLVCTGNLSNFISHKWLAWLFHVFFKTLTFLEINA